MDAAASGDIPWWCTPGQRRGTPWRRCHRRRRLPSTQEASAVTPQWRQAPHGFQTWSSITRPLHQTRMTMPNPVPGARRPALPCRTYPYVPSPPVISVVRRRCSDVRWSYKKHGALLVSLDEVIRCSDMRWSYKNKRNKVKSGLSDLDPKADNGVSRRQIKEPE
jgi:hypothetical protein